MIVDADRPQKRIIPQSVLIACWVLNHLNAELNPICHLLALVGGHHILHVSRIRDKATNTHTQNM